MFGSFLSWGLILQAIALVHFFNRRPESFWIWVIIFLGPLGASVYLVVEMVPDLGLLRQSFDAFGRRKRIRLLEALVLQNPAAGNYEELGDLYLDEEKFSRARECYDKAISPRTDHPDPYYRRGIAEIRLEDFPAAVRDLEWVTARDAKYDSYRALGLLAHAYGKVGETARADTLFRQATELSTASETYFNYASFLAAAGRREEARDWAQRILAKKPTMPRYLQRVERPWFRKAAALIKTLPAASSSAST
jgi:hypothetical protein